MKDGTARTYDRHITIIAKGASIVFGGTVIGSGLKYVFEALVARYLGAEVFGIFFLGFTIYGVLGSLATLGLQNGVLRYVSLFRGTGDEARLKGTILLSVRAVLIASALICLLLLAFSRPISVGIFHEGNLTSVLRVFALGIVLTAVTDILVFSIQAVQIVKYRILVRMIFEPGLRIVLVVIVFLLGWKLQGVLAAFLASLIPGTFLAVFFLKKVFPSVQDRLRPVYETKEILAFSWPLFLLGFLDLFIVQISTLMLGHFKTPQDVGIYGAAQRTAFLIPVVLTSFNAVFAPMIADLYHRKELKTLENLFKTVTQWIFTVSFPLFLVMVLFAEDILAIWGGAYKTGAVCLIIICCAQLVNCAVGSVGFVIMMTGRTILSLFNNLFVCVAVVVLNDLFIPRYGLVGAAVSLALALASVNVIRLIEVYYILKIHPYRVAYYKPLLAGAAATAVSWALKQLWGPSVGAPLLRLAVYGSVIALVYLIALLGFSINEEEKLVWRRMMEKLRPGQT